jgi:hypothetical protein
MQYKARLIWCAFWKQSSLLASVAFVLSLTSWESCRATDAEQAKLIYDQCVQLAQCNNSTLVKCPLNFICMNNCLIGRDPNVAGRRAGNFFSNIIGFSRTAEYQQTCLSGCIQNKDLICLGPQPEDPEMMDIHGDPALRCLQYCGAANQWCQLTCSFLVPLSQCYKTTTAAKGDPEACLAVMPQMGQLGEMYAGAEPYVIEKLREFTYEALCFLKPTATRCASFCNDHKDARTCKQKALNEQAAEIQKEEERQTAINQGVNAALSGAQTANKESNAQVEDLPLDQQAYQKEIDEFVRSQK